MVNLETLAKGKRLISDDSLSCRLAQVQSKGGKFKAFPMKIRKAFGEL
jgi:hypothetical protein